MITVGPPDVTALRAGLEQRILVAKRDALELARVLGPQYIRGNFRRQEGPRGPWKKTIRGGRIFFDRQGRMEKGVTAETRGDTVWIGAGEATSAYNAIHNFGGYIRPHIIRPKNKQALFWKGAKHPVKLVLWPGATMPQREFMYLRDQDRNFLRRAMQDLFVKRLNGGR